MTTAHVQHARSPTVVYDGWTFGNTIPGAGRSGDGGGRGGLHHRVSVFRIVGAICDWVYVGGFGAPLEGVQTFNVPVGGGAIFDARLVEEGLYPFVSHAFADATKGAVGILRAGNPSGTMAH